MSLLSPFNRLNRLVFAVAFTWCSCVAGVANAAPAAPEVPGNEVAQTSFTRICWNGDVEGQGSCTVSLSANTDAAPRQAAGDWACSRDNVNKLVWSLRSVKADWEEANSATFADTGHNRPARCGYRNGWRLPTRSELTGIVGQGRSPGPMLESAYFPRTRNETYWSSDTFATDPGYAWGVLYGYNGSVAYYKTLPTHVRLVHSAE